MLPPKNDPRWTWFIDHIGETHVTDLSAKMFLSRLKMQAGGGHADKRELIAMAHAFFTKHETALADDIRRIFADEAGRKNS
jgi:hypothetical protein